MGCDYKMVNSGLNYLLYKVLTYLLDRLRLFPTSLDATLFR